MGAKKPKANMSDEEMEEGEQVGFSSEPKIQSEPPHLSESAAITKACDEALSSNVRNLSGPKRAAILNAVEAAVTAVRDEAEKPHGEMRDLKEFLSESGLTVPQLRSVLQEAEINLGLIDTLTGVLECGRAHLADAVINLQQEREQLTRKLTLLQDQVKRYSQPRVAVEERPEEAQGKTFSWRKLTERLISAIDRKNELIMQVHGESHGRTDGQWKHPSLDLQGGLQDGAKKYSLAEKTSESELSFYSEKLGQNDPSSSANPNQSDMWDVLKAMLRAQTAANVERYTGKNSLSDFLRAFNIKYPQQSWSNHERRDILVSLLDGPAKLMYSNLSRGIQEGSFEDIVEALEKARRDPCKKLKKIEEWDRLRKRDCETVEEFCYRMESISREIHSEGDRDFLLGSKLHTCLSDWNDSYHMLTALEAPNGMVYQSVRNAALRLERGREALRAKFQPQKGQRQDHIDPGKHRGHGNADNGEVLRDGINGKNVPVRKTKCFRCGEIGHYARKCPNANAQVSPPCTDDRQKRKSNSEKPVGSFSAHLEKWCGAVINGDKKDMVTEAYGKPLICRVQMLGMTVDAMIDTGSVVSIIPLGLLLEAKKKMINLDELVTIMGDGNSQKVMDASGNTMSFLMLIATEVDVQGAGKARVQLHIQRSRDRVVLLGMNALRALNIHIQFGEHRLQRDQGRKKVSGPVQAVHRHVIPAKGISTVTVSGNADSDECIFWSNNSRISSGVLKVSHGEALVSVRNSTMEPWVIREGETLGKWGEEEWHDPRTRDLPGDMLELSRNLPRMETNRIEDLLTILNSNRKAGQLPDRLTTLITKYEDVFAISDLELTQTDLVQHSIDVGGNPPIKQRTRPVPYALRSQVREMLVDLKGRGIIEESSSPWASPIVLVAKKDGSIRLCVDYREVNKKIKKDSYPLPPIDMTLQNLRGKKHFTSLDLASGYWQIPLDEEAKEVSAFTTTAGLFQFRVLPFGLSTAPAVFQRLMEKVLGSLMGAEVSVYIDDMLVATETLERHVEVLEQVFQALRRAHLKLKPQKCRILENSIEFLGHVVDQDGLRTDPGKIEKICKYPQPTNLAQLRTFLGMTGYYRKFIFRYAHIAQPLYDLTSTKSPFSWSEVHEQAFTTLKDLLTRAPVLGQPDVEAARNGTRPFFIYTDASRSGVGAVLAQEGDDKLIHPLHFASRGLSRAERNYHVTDQEALGVMFAVKKFHCFIYGVRTIVRTDHAALTSLFKRANVSPRVLRWALELQRYDLDIEYIKGAANNVADALSRGAVSDKHTEMVRDAEMEKVVAVVKDLDWLEELREDEEFKTVIKSVEAQKDDEIRFRRHAKKLSTADFELSDGKLRLIREDGSKVNVIPRSKRRELFAEAHHGYMGGHFSAKKMIAQMEKIAFWPGFKQDIEKWCQECQICFVNNAHRVNTPPLKPLIVSRPFEIIGIDLLEMGLSSRGNRYIVTIIDHFTKFLGAYPVPNKKAETIAEVLFSQWICGTGRWPETVLSDRGAEFENAIVTALCDIMGIKQQFTKGHCPRENGVTERVNGTIVRMLRKKTVVPAEWDIVLPAVVYAYNACPHEATGESPHFLLYGQDPKYPSQVIPTEHLSPCAVDYDQYKIEFLAGLKLARDCISLNMEEYRKKMKEQYDKRFKTDKASIIKEGDRVYVKVPHEKGKASYPKLATDWSGPYRVIESSTNSALVTLIGENREPIRVQWDHLLKLPQTIDNTPLKTKGTRGRRGRRCSLLITSCCGTIRNKPCFRESSMTATNPIHIDFICPGGLSIDGQRLPCASNMTWCEISGSRNSPVDSLSFDSVYKLARVATIMSQTHTSMEMRMARILDSCYDALSPTGLGFAISFFSAKCLHVMQGMQARFSTGHQNFEPHPRRTNEDPYDLPSLFDYACSWAQAHPWNDELWESLPPKKSLVLLPYEFKEHVYSIQSHCQVVHVYSKPDDVQESWCQDEYSAVVLFSPSKAFDSSAWAQAWQLILGMISDGVELFVLGCPRDNRQWPKAIDGLRDICEETVTQKPKLQTRIKCLLMTRSEESLAFHPCNIITDNTGVRSYSPSAVKKFYEATRSFCIAHIRLTPYYQIRTKEETQRDKSDNGREERHSQHGRPPKRFYPKKYGFKQKPYRWNRNPPIKYRGPRFESYREPNPMNVGEPWPHSRKNFRRG